MTSPQPIIPECAARLVIGVGNVHRRDDGVGIHVARRVQSLAAPGITVIESSGEGASLMDAWEHASEVVLIDAVRSGSTPGFVHRLDAGKAQIPSDFFHYSTHAFSVAEAVEMSRALDTLPGKIVIFGIEGHDFSSGIGLSAAVDEASEKVIKEVLAEFRSTIRHT